MKSKLLLRIWSKARCALFGYVFLSLFGSALVANDKIPPETLYTGGGKITNDRNANAPDTLITGKIVDVNGNVVTGASVVERGSSTGTMSDAQGNFSLNVKSSKSTIVISFVNYSDKEVSVDTLSARNITLQPFAKNLDDVVVVGYGTQKKSELKNAVVQVAGAELKKSNAISLSNSLSGRLAGLFVNQRSSVPGFDDAQILIRGVRTYRNNSALIVIDGVANADPDGLSRLDPNDIETISVLKDASAAIYGAQAAGGVILVTTKRGKVGKPAFDFSTTFSWQSPTKKVRSADVFQYMNVLNQRRALEGTPPDFPDALVNAFKNGDRRPENWYDALVDAPAPQSRQSLTMRGGTERVKYFLSIGMATQGGILRGDDKTKLKQYNVRSNIDVNVAQGFDVGLDISYREKNTETPQSAPGGDVGAFANTSPLQEAYIGGDYRYPGEGWSHSNPAARLLSPGYRKYKVDVASGTIRAKYNIPFLKGLAVDGFVSLIKDMHYNKIFNYTWFYYERGVNPGEIVKKVSRTIEDIGLREEFDQSQKITSNIKLSYGTRIGDHKINAFVMYEQWEYKFNRFNAQRLGYASPLIDQLSAGSTDRQNWSNDGGASESSRQNFSGRISYDFRSKYLLDFSARYDGSPIFPEETRFGFFPQASAAWVITNEDFMPKNIFSNLKLRASWGQLGNDRVDPFQYIGAFAYVINNLPTPGFVVNGADVRGIGATTTPNPNITWEVTETTDIGVEAGFLQNRFTLELDWYQTKTKNILGKRQASIPGYTGLVLPDENIGKMNSNGFEVQVGYRQNFGQLGLRLSGNLSYTDNKIIYFDEAPLAEPYQKLEGHALNAELLYKSIGIYRSASDLTKYTSYAGAKVGGLIFADLNGDGKVDGNDRYRYNSSVFPRWQGGLTIGLDYKAFDLTMLIQGQSGAKFKLSNGFSSAANGNGLKYVAENTFSLTNTNSELPMIAPTGVANENSDFFYRESTWARMKSIELGYNMPTKLISRLRIAALRFYLSSDNAFLIYNNLEKYGAGDPEFIADNSNPPNRIGNGGAYPNMKTLSVGLNITF